MSDDEMFEVPGHILRGMRLEIIRLTGELNAARVRGDTLAGSLRGVLGHLERLVPPAEPGVAANRCGWFCLDDPPIAVAAGVLADRSLDPRP